jgi:hypothetical protein
VIAGRENVGRDHVGERDDMGALVDARHQRGRQGVATMGEDDVAAASARLGALGLHHGGKPREAAAAPAIGRHLIVHQIDVIDQDEGDARGLGEGCSNKEHREGGDGEQATGEDHDGVQLLRAWHYGSKLG